MTYKNVNISGSTKKLQLQRSSCSAATQRVEKLYFISSNEEKSYIFIRSVKRVVGGDKQESGKSEVENGKWRETKPGWLSPIVVVDSKLFGAIHSSCTSLCHTHMEFDTQLAGRHTWRMRIPAPAKGLERVPIFEHFFLMCVVQPATGLTDPQPRFLRAKNFSH